MLGKGLESLIPPSKKPNGAGSPSGGNSSAPDPGARPFEPAKEGNVPADLPVASSLPEPEIEEEEEQAPAEEKLFLPEEEDDSLIGEPISTAATKSEPEYHPQPAISRSTPAARPAQPRNREESIFYLEVSKIRPNAHQPRKYFDEEAIKDLAASIREFGVLQPIVVTKHETETPHGTEVEYELIAGERRLMASKSLGLERIPAIIRNVDLERERLEMAIIENLQREDLNGIEMARAFARLQDEFRLTQREIAVRLGKSRESVANTMRLLDLPSYIQTAIEEKKISDSHGLLLLGVDDSALQQALFNDLLSNKLTIRELRQKARMSKKDRTGEDSGGGEFRVFEEELSSNLGAPVSIERRGGKGQITIKFYSEEELQGILDKLQKEENS